MSLSYVWLGKIPHSEMMKSTQRYGSKMWCGWLRPTELTEPD